MMFSVMKSWLMANVNWSSELLKGFSINDKWCCWLSCLLWHHKTFQEVASFIQGSPEEVAAFDGICDDLVMLYGQACLVITPLSPLGSHITSIKQIFFALNAELSPSDITQSPALVPIKSWWLPISTPNSDVPLNSWLINTIGQLLLMSHGISNLYSFI